MTKLQILFQGHYNQSQLDDFKELSHWQIRDVYQEQLAELYEIDHPGQQLTVEFDQLQQQYIDKKSGSTPELQGNWIYYPWSGYIVHTVDQLDYYRLRTNRNQLLITTEEQQRLADSCVGLVGLSIGSHFASTLAYSGIAQTMKLAEFDSLSTTNLNRIQAKLIDVGQKKLDIISQQLYEINPYQQLDVFEQGLNDQTLDDFMSGQTKPNLVFEAVDDFAMKIKLRLAAKQQGIPIIMLTNLGDTMLIDVERYDTEPDGEIFNGAIGTTAEEILNKPLTERDKVRYAVKIVSLEHTPTRALQTLLEINKTLVGRPQLASTVTIGGGIAAFLGRRIILGQPLPSGRYHISFTESLGLEDSDSYGRTEAINQIQERFAA